MKQMNKLITGVVTLATVVTLSACQSSHNNTKLVSMKGDTITVSDFYNETKNTELAQKAMLSLVISRVFETQYANKVSHHERTTHCVKNKNYHLINLPLRSCLRASCSMHNQTLKQIL